MERRCSDGNMFSEYRTSDLDSAAVGKLVTRSKSLSTHTDVPSVASQRILHDLDMYYIRQLTSSLEDHDLQRKIEHEIKMRDGTVKLLAASRHPVQMLEAARNMLTSNARILAYMTDLQERKTSEILGRTELKVGDQSPCKADLCVSDIRIPLMWKDSDHFRNRGDCNRYQVFCLVKVGSQIQDTVLSCEIDRNSTDISFDDVLLFNDVPCDFTCQFEVYSHKLIDDFTIASTPRKLRKKINNISSSVGRSVGKRLSGLKENCEILGNTVMGPRFTAVAASSMKLSDVDDTIGTYSFHEESEKSSDIASSELPLFGHYCCRLAAVPHCLTRETVSGYLRLQEDEELGKWYRYWCLLKNLQLACWNSPTDVDVTEALFTIPVTKNTQISEADPNLCKEPYTFHLKTIHRDNFTCEHFICCESEGDKSKWWDGFQQHLLDQAMWKHACENIMTLKKGPEREKPRFSRKTSLYDETPVYNRTTRSNSDALDKLKMDESQISRMLDRLMNEAKHIRGPSTSAAD